MSDHAADERYEREREEHGAILRQAEAEEDSSVSLDRIADALEGILGELRLIRETMKQVRKVRFVAMNNPPFGG